MGILDSIIDSRQASLAKEFEPLLVAQRVLNKLKDRDRKILASRYGLDEGGYKTLEAIGRDLRLTRERVRQLETRALKELRASAPELSLYLLTE